MNETAAERTIRDTLLGIHKQISEIEDALSELVGPGITSDKVKDEPGSTMEFVSASLLGIETRIGGIMERVDFARSMLG